MYIKYIKYIYIRYACTHTYNSFLKFTMDITINHYTVLFYQMLYKYVNFRISSLKRMNAAN